MNVFHKAIFRAKNTGNNLKISLPFENIIDIEQTEAVEFQQFLQIRAVGIDDSFVVDEVTLEIYNIVAGNHINMLPVHSTILPTLTTREEPSNALEMFGIHTNLIPGRATINHITLLLIHPATSRHPYRSLTFLTPNHSR